MEHLLKRSDTFENLEAGILFGQVGEETEHSPSRSDKFHNQEEQEWPRQMLMWPSIYHVCRKWARPVSIWVFNNKLFLDYTQVFFQFCNFNIFPYTGLTFKHRCGFAASSREHKEFLCIHDFLLIQSPSYKKTYHRDSLAWLINAHWPIITAQIIAYVRVRFWRIVLILCLCIHF